MYKKIMLILLPMLLFSSEYVKYKRTLLTKPNGVALKIQDIKEDEIYIFRYPYFGTPAFLIKHTFFDDHNQSSTKILAYSAINPRTLNFVKEDICIISFEDNKIKFCDDKSTYALNNNKMTKIILKIKNNRIFAVGVNTKELLIRYFKFKKAQIKKEFRSFWNAKKTYGRRKVYKNTDFSKVLVRCN